MKYIKFYFIYIILAGLSGCVSESKSMIIKPLTVHPKAFEMVECWMSDMISPVVVSINLDALKCNGNQFSDDEILVKDGWAKYTKPDGRSFSRYKVIQKNCDGYTVKFQSNGGGTLTIETIIRVVIEDREIEVDGTIKVYSVMRVVSFRYN